MHAYYTQSLVHGTGVLLNANNVFQALFQCVMSILTSLWLQNMCRTALLLVSRHTHNEMGEN